MTNTQVKIVYTAGLFDGDGCVYVSKWPHKHAEHHRPSYGLGVAFASANVAGLEVISGWFGGKVKVRMNRKKGYMAYELHITGTAKIFAFLRAIQPYVVMKKKEVDAILRYWPEKLWSSDYDSRAKVYRLVKKYKKLNKCRLI